jgi:cyanophycin synthetase
MEQQTSAFCVYCWPTKRTSHFDLKLDYYFTRVIRVVETLLRPFSGRAPKSLRAKSPYRFSHRLWGWYLEVFRLAGLIKFVKDPLEANMNIRNLVFFREGQKRGLDIYATKLAGRTRYGNDIKFRYHGRNHYYEAIPLTMRGTSLEVDDKARVKKLLRENDIPVSEGRTFISKRSGMAYGRQLGFPLVVKPRTGSLAQHVMVYLNSEDELSQAIDIVKLYQPSFIVEKFLEGGMHRGTVIDQQHVFIVLRDRANVVGDGAHTIRQLMELKNADPRRAEAFDASASLHKMPFDEITEAHLASEGLNFESIPVAGQRVDIYGPGKLLPDRGNDIINLTRQAHPDNVELFRRVAALLDIDLVGIDFVVPDITRSYKEQVSGMLEANSIPYVDMHTNPSIGQSEPIVELIWDLALGDLER